MPAHEWFNIEKVSKPAREALHQYLIQTQAVQSCLNCEFSDQENNICTRYNVPPPMKVAVYGCEGWEGEIPF